MTNYKQNPFHNCNEYKFEAEKVDIRTKKLCPVKKKSIYVSIS